jgi:enoyl-CoA hydratase
VADSFVRVQRDGDIATVTLDRPAKLNSLTPAMLDELEHAVRAFDADATLRVVVLSASGERAFCVGADINEWAALKPLDMWRRWVKRGH